METRWQLENITRTPDIYLVRRTCTICGMGLTTKLAGPNKCWHTQSKSRFTCLGCGFHTQVR